MSDIPSIESLRLITATAMIDTIRARTGVGSSFEGLKPIHQRAILEDADAILGAILKAIRKEP